MEVLTCGHGSVIGGRVSPHHQAVMLGERANVIDWCDGTVGGPQPPRGSTNKLRMPVRRVLRSRGGKAGGTPAIWVLT